ncbi:hypothetical protein GHT06_009032 [Daphnia sinensis]|uniref:Uncharacterized protein n=1 Tax=Daphnia sinensis TaxID=1820382 RepID=A0AAD5L291_9CRUS|nr:hypothetical protein GHT06_009032 [Daphnia sinensis]
MSITKKGATRLQRSGPNTAAKHPSLRILHKCENLICVQVGQLRLQCLLKKPTLR